MTALKTEDYLIKDKLMFYIKNKNIDIYDIEFHGYSISKTINEIISRKIPLKKGDAFEFEMNKIGLYFSESGKLIDGKELHEDMSFTLYVTSHMLKSKKRYHHLNLDELDSERIVFKVLSNKYDKINSMMSFRDYFIIKVKKIISNSIKSLGKE